MASTNGRIAFQRHLKELHLLHVSFVVRLEGEGRTTGQRDWFNPMQVRVAESSKHPRGNIDDIRVFEVSLVQYTNDLMAHLIAKSERDCARPEPLHKETVGDVDAVGTISNLYLLFRKVAKRRYGL